LPSIRQLATDLELNPNTVAKAYQYVERSRIIKTAGRRGTLIHPNAKGNVRLSNRDLFSGKLSEIFEKMYEAGVSGEQIREIVEEILNSK
jgi:GntR family transcriptional regulator